MYIVGMQAWLRHISLGIIGDASITVEAEVWHDSTQLSKLPFYQLYIFAQIDLMAAHFVLSVRETFREVIKVSPPKYYVHELFLLSYVYSYKVGTHAF